MSKAVNAEPNGTTAQPETTEDERPLTNDGIYGLINDLDWDGVPAVHRRKIRDLLVRVTDEEIGSFPVTFTNVSVSVNQFGDTVLTLFYDAGSISTYDVQKVGIDLDTHGFQAWHDRTALYLHSDE